MAAHIPLAVIDERKTKAVRALMSGLPMTQAAEMAGVSRQTIWHWKTRDAEFICELNRSQIEQKQAIEGAVLSLTPEAVTQARAILLDREAPQSVRAQIICSLLSFLSAYLKRHPERETDLEKVKEKLWFLPVTPASAASSGD